MDTTAELVWHAFLQSSPLDQRHRLLHLLSPELFNEINQLPSPSSDPTKGVEPVEGELSKIHFSWLAPLLRSFSEHEIKLFVSCLTPQQIKDLKTALLLSNTLPTLSTMGTVYLQKTLFNMLTETELIPISCLPIHPLNSLLELTFEELLSLIDLLSMHDLSVEIRHIIETAKLKEIYSLLSKAQITFLKTLLHKKETVLFKKMGLSHWKGDREMFRSMLLQRGVNRIAKALYGCNPSLLWYIAHRLDTEKGRLLMHLCTALDHPRASTLLSEQVIELIHAIKNNNPLQNL